MTLWHIGYHVWNLGHSIEVTKYNTALAKGASRGWLIRCECHKSWTR